MQQQSSFIAIAAALLFALQAFCQEDNETESRPSVRENFRIIEQSPRQQLSFRIDRVMAEELGLLDTQLEEIRQLQGEFLELVHSEIAVPEELDQEKQIEFVKENRQKMFDDFSNALDEILLPAQRERLEEIRLQKMIGTKVTGRTFTNPQILAAIGISHEDAINIQRRAAEIRKTLDEKIAKMEKEAEEELLAELSDKQREALKQVIGSRYETAHERRMRKMEEDGFDQF